MTATAKSAPGISWEDYEAGELQSEIRHEFVNGQVFAMAGGSDNHNRIALNIAAELRRQLKGNPCEPFTSDMKLRIHREFDTLGYHPDAMVVCDPEDKHRYHRERPTVLIEITSTSTERIDKREKLLAYITIESLGEYVIIDQRRKHATVYRRSANWKPEVLEGDDAELALGSIGCAIPFADVYERVDWREQEPLAPLEL